MQKRNFRLILAGVALAAASFTSAAADRVFSNNTYIAVPASGTAGPANPYPSTVNVSGLSGSYDRVTVSLNGFSHTWSSDLVIVLVSPAGQKVALISNVGGSADYTGGVYTFSDSAAGIVSGSPIMPGTYKPSGGTSVINPPAPPGPYGASMNALGGAASTLNGTWSLYIDDQAGSDAGAIANGWTLTLGNNFTSCAAEGFTGPKLTLCQQICEVPQSQARLDVWIKKWLFAYKVDPPCGVL